MSESAQILIPKWGKFERFQRQFERECRFGTFLHKRIERERQDTHRRMQEVAERNKDYVRKPGAELNLEAVVDARTFFRWQQTDTHFWDDPANIKRFVKDNPQAAPWKH